MIKVNDTEITDKNEFADLFNSHFSTIGTNIANQIPDASVSVNDFITQSDSTFNFEPITDRGVE